MCTKCIIIITPTTEMLNDSIREKAETDYNLMSIIIDGMDQNSTRLPHLKIPQKIRTNVTGIIFHGHDSYALLDFFQWLHDPNMTCNILIKV